MSEKRGKLIVIDGTDCSGKATQTKLLIDRLNEEGTVSQTMSFPRYDTPTGKIVGGPYLGKPEISSCWFPGGPNSVDPEVACLYYAADRRAHRDELVEGLNNGENWILDRYVEANMGHQAGKKTTEAERKYIVNFLDNLEYGLLNLPKPDKVILLYMPFKVGIELKKDRPGEADGHESNPEHLRNAEEAYLQIAKWRDWHVVNCAPDGTVGSLRTREDIHDEVYSIASKLIGDREK